MNIDGLWLTFLSGICTGIGGLLGILLSGYGQRLLGLMLGLSAGIMTTISLLDILPASFAMLTTSSGETIALVGILLALMSGMLFGGFLNLSLAEKEKSHKLYRLGILSMVSLMAHNLPEGIAVYVGSERDISLGIGLAIAIGIHNIPEGIAIALPIRASGGSAIKGFSYALLSGLAEPLGGLLGYLLLSVMGDFVFLEYIMAGVAGLMLYLSFAELLPIAIEKGGTARMVLGVMLGILVMATGIFLA